MSNAKFTKGVWVANYGGSIGHVKALLNVSTHNTPTVARCDVLTTSISNDEKKANAQLIAEAPELYRMLSDFKDFAVRQGWNHVLINDAEKLLAKVRGES
tara:strand:- start:893 stop:1192 length:300 start_codon:yes stop_codon:yes gene_type:complete